MTRTTRQLAALTVIGGVALGLGYAAADAQPTPATANVGTVGLSGRTATAKFAARVYANPRSIRSVTITIQIRRATRPGQWGRAWAQRVYTLPPAQRVGYGSVTRTCRTGRTTAYLYAIVRVRVVHRDGRVLMNRLTSKSPTSTTTRCVA